jgi:ribosomal protein L39E
MNSFERIAEEKIRQAMQEGKFDALSGRGKPLTLEEDALVPEDQRLAQHVLHAQGFIPAWMEARHEIDAALHALRRDFRRQYLLAAGAQDRDALGAAFSRQIAALNRQILGYNVRVPGWSFERPSLDADSEMRAALAASANEE